MVYYVLLLLRCFSCSHTVLSKEHSLGVIFFLLTFLMFAVFFFKNPCISLLIVLCMIVYVTNKPTLTLTLTFFSSVIVTYYNYIYFVIKLCNSAMLQLLPNTDDQPPRRPAPCKINPFLLDYWSFNLMYSFETDFSNVQAY